MMPASYLGFLFLTLVSAAHNSESSDSSREISVMLSERKPFVLFNENGMPVGLDVSIIENFARKYKLKIKYNFHDTTQIDFKYGNSSFRLKLFI